MDSVYKLTKYSQKITDACQKKQYEKIGLYNKHENLYIKKLNEYFGNQKGGADLEELNKFFREISIKIREIIKRNKELTEKEGTDRMEVERERLESQREIKRLAEQNEKLRDTKLMLEKTIGDLQDQLRAQGEDIRRITDKLTSEMDPDAKQSISDQIETNQRLQLELQNKVSQISDLELRLIEAKKLPQLLEEAAAEVEQRGNKISELNQQIQICTTKNLDLKADAASLTDRIESLVKELDNAQQAAQQSGQSGLIAGLEAQLQSAREDKDAALLAAAKATAQATEQAAQAAQHKEAEYEGKIKELQEQLQEASRKLQQIETEARQAAAVGGGRRR
jgi:hypothetical protein